MEGDLQKQERMTIKSIISSGAVYHLLACFLLFKSKIKATFSKEIMIVDERLIPILFVGLARHDKSSSIIF